MNEIKPGTPDSNTPDKYAELKKLVKCFEIEIIDAMNKIKAGKNTIVFFDSLKTCQELKKYLSQTKDKEIRKQYLTLIHDTLFANFDIDINELEPSLIREYSIKDTPETQGKKEIKVNVFKTRHPGILMEKYFYPDTSVAWALRADK